MFIEHRLQPHPLFYFTLPNCQRQCLSLDDLGVGRNPHYLPQRVEAEEQGWNTIPHGWLWPQSPCSVRKTWLAIPMRPQPCPPRAPITGLPMMWRHFWPVFHVVCVSDGIHNPMGVALFGESTTRLNTIVTDKELFWPTYICIRLHIASKADLAMVWPWATSGTAQLLTFVHGIMKDFELTEELAPNQSMKGKTTVSVWLLKWI